MNTPHVIGYAVEALGIAILVFALAFWIARRWGGRWALWSAGAITFIASQVVHLPVLALVTGLFRLPGAPHVGGTLGLIIQGVLLGLFAGVCEELARWVALRFALKHARAWRDGMMFGAGHGGMEALLVAFSVISSLIGMMALRPGTISSLPPAQQAQVAAQQQAFWNAPLLNLPAGLVERCFALCIHLACALLVLEAVRRRNWLWLLAAIGWHAVNDASAVIAQPCGIWPTEGILFLFAIVSVLIIMRMRRRDTPRDLEISDSVGELKNRRPFVDPATDPREWTSTRPQA